MSTYNTEARQKLLAFLAAHRERAYTVPELVENLRGEISSSTIYRLVKALVLEEKIRLLPQKSSPLSLYQYVDQEQCQLHLHLHCTRCGLMIHVDDNISQQVYNEILKRNSFSINRSQTVLLGLCQKCKFA